MKTTNIIDYDLIGKLSLPRESGNKYSRMVFESDKNLPSFIILKSEKKYITPGLYNCHFQKEKSGRHVLTLYLITEELTPDVLNNNSELTIPYINSMFDSMYTRPSRK